MKRNIARILCLALFILCLALTACKKADPTTATCSDHTPGAAVKENTVAATCLLAGSYDEVVYCSVDGCGKEISRVTKTVPATGHTPGAATVIEATCASTGCRETSCTVCNEIIESISIPTLPHDFSESHTCGECEYVWPASEGLTFYSNGDGTCILGDRGSCYDPDIVIPYFSPNGNRVVSIRSSAFRGCSNIKSIVFPDSITVIDEAAFFQCTGLKSVVLPRNLTTIGDYAFGLCSQLATADIPEAVRSIGEGAFASTAITSANIPEGVEVIRDSAFSMCSRLKSVTIPGTVKTIEQDAFMMSGVKSVVICEGLERIDSAAFYACSSLESITLPSTLKSIGSLAFTSCNRLEKVYISDIDAWHNVEFTDYDSNPMNLADSLYLNGVLFNDPDACPGHADDNDDNICDNCDTNIANKDGCLIHIDQNGNNRCDNCNTVIEVASPQ